VQRLGAELLERDEQAAKARERLAVLLSAKTSIATDSGSRCWPAWNASRPSTTYRYTEMTKNVPMRTSCCPTSADSPARCCAFRGGVVRLGW
jgi:hypothetical protein